MEQKIILLISLFGLGILNGYSQDQKRIFNTNIVYTSPNQKVWNLVSDEKPSIDKKGLLKFMHLPIKDRNGDSIEPVLAILYETINKNIDVTEYSVSILADHPYNIERKILGGYPQYSNDKHSIVFKGNYTRDGVGHDILLGFIFYNNRGIEIIADATTSIYNFVEKDFKEFVKSVYIKE